MPKTPRKSPSRSARSKAKVRAKHRRIRAGKMGLMRKRKPGGRLKRFRS